MVVCEIRDKVVFVSELFHDFVPCDIEGVGLVWICGAYTFGFVVQGGVFLPPPFVALDRVFEFVEECVPVSSSHVLAYSVADVGPAGLTNAYSFVERRQDAPAVACASATVVFQEPMAAPYA